MANKKNGNLPTKQNPTLDLQVIRIGTFRPSLQTLSSLDCGIDLSSYAYEGLKKWK